MKRRVIQLAGKTFVVTLPTEWVKEWGIKKGEEVEVTENGPRLIVSTSTERALKKGIIDISEVNERTLRWLLSSLHKKGYDEIEIHTTNKEHEKIISDLLKNLFLGFAVVQETKTGCIIKCLSKELDSELQTIVRRAFLVTLSFADEVAACAKNKKFDELSKVKDMELVNNQLTNWVERILNKKGLDEPVKTSFLYVIMWNLEKIADSYKYLAEELERKKTIKKESVELLIKVNELLRAYYNLFYKFEVMELSRLSDAYKELGKEIESKMQGEDAVILSHLNHITIKIADFSSSTFALHN